MNACVMLAAIVGGDTATAAAQADIVNADAGNPIGALAVAACMLAAAVKPTKDDIHTMMTAATAATATGAANDGGASAVLLVAARAVARRHLTMRLFVMQPVVDGVLGRLAESAGEPPARLVAAIAAGVTVISACAADSICEREIVDALGLASTHPAVRKCVAANTTNVGELDKIPLDVAADWALAYSVARPFQMRYPVWLTRNINAPAGHRVAAILIIAYAIGQSSETRADAAKLLSAQLETGAGRKPAYKDAVELLALYIVDVLGDKRGAVLPPVVI